VTIPKHYKFMKPTLELLKDNQVHTREDMYKVLARRLQLTKKELKETLPKSKQPVYQNIISSALAHLKKVKAIESPTKANFRITELGHKILTENPEIINSNYLKTFESFQNNIGSNESPQDLMDKAYKTISNTLADDLLIEVMNQSPTFFEKLVVDLLVSMGYGGSRIENGQILGKSGDEGIDGVIEEDKLGFDKIYIQAKRRDTEKTVGRPELQKFVGALTGQGASKGAFITTARFTKEAEEYVSKQHACKIVLIDGRTLAALMIEHNLGISVGHTYLIKKIDTDYFNGE